MGNCFGPHKNRNRVEPAPDTGNNDGISEIISKSTPFQKTSPRHMIKELTIYGQEPSVNQGGVAFTVDFNEGNPARMPSRLADRLDGVIDEEEEILKSLEVTYTTEEKEILAELLRDGILREKKDKAAQEELKIQKAARRREKKAISRNTESSIDTETPDADERRQRVKQMAAEARLRAAENGRKIS